MSRDLKINSILCFCGMINCIQRLYSYELALLFDKNSLKCLVITQLITFNLKTAISDKYTYEQRCVFNWLKTRIMYQANSNRHHSNKFQSTIYDLYVSQFEIICIKYPTY